MEQQRSTLDKSLSWLVLSLLLFGCLAVLRPFVSALLWAVVLTVSCWPLYRRVLNLTGTRHTLASLMMLVGMVLILLAPFVIVGVTLADNVKDLTAAVRKWAEAGPPGPPAWLAKVPVVGEKAVEYWQQHTVDTGEMLGKLKELIQTAGTWLLRGGLALGSGLIELALSILTAFFLFRNGAGAVERLNHGVERISGERGKHLLLVAGRTVRGVVYGILGTALAQAILATLGFFVAGVPGAVLLGLLTFFSSVVPIAGTALVWLPAALWLFAQGSTGWGIFMLVWGFGVANVDNVIKPWLISQGSNMPFLLIFFGVIGGALTFGFIGVFLGPTLLAVGWKLVEEWVPARPAVSDAKTANAVPPA